MTIKALLILSALKALILQTLLILKLQLQVQILGQQKRFPGIALPNLLGEFQKVFLLQEKAFVHLAGKSKPLLVLELYK